MSKTCPGNGRLKALAVQYLDDYSNAENKTEKSKIVSKIVEMVHSKCPVGAFIKYQEGLWYEVSKSVAREKVGIKRLDWK